MSSEMSSGDPDTIGYSIGMTEPDNWKSKIYNGYIFTLLIQLEILPECLELLLPSFLTLLNLKMILHLIMKFLILTYGLV